MKPDNVFVIGHDEWNRRWVEDVRNPERYRFHPLLSHRECHRTETIDFDGLLEKARSILKEFDGSVDALITHWDFPCTSLLAVLAEEWDLPAPSPAAMMRCEHKFWARTVQRATVPDHTPGFTAINPFDPPGKGEVELEYPFWLKPVKGVGSALGFHVDDYGDLERALERTRGEIGHMGKGFSQALARVELPDGIRGVDGMWCVAEELVDGLELAPEGYVRNGITHCHGLIDCVRDENGKSFQRWEYPAARGPEIHERIRETARRLMPAMGYDQGCFNIEFMWNAREKRLSVVEVNPRISQSHSYQFDKINGVSNHEVAVQLALGREPDLPGEGAYRHASKCVLRKFEQGRVARVPADDELEALENEFPDCRVRILVEEGLDLSELKEQDVYSFQLAFVYVAGKTREEMMERYDAIVDRLDFRFEDERPIGDSA